VYLPNLPYVTGRLPAKLGSQYPTTGFVFYDATAGTNPGEILYNQNTKIMTPTAFVTSSYVGWRGGTVYSTRLNQHRADDQHPVLGGYGAVGHLAISRVTSSLASYVTAASVWSSMTWNVTRLNDQSIPATNAYSGYQCLAKSERGLSDLAHGTGGMAVTNPDKVDVVNAIIPYYSNNRMMPANPIANYYVVNKPDEIAWNKADGGMYPAGTNELIQCPRVDFDVQCYSNIDGNRSTRCLHSMCFTKQESITRLFGILTHQPSTFTRTTVDILSGGLECSSHTT
jgi:hypothetical protein